MSQNKTCINKLIAKLSGVDDKITSLSESLKVLKEMIDKQSTEDESEEECPDVVESEKAIVEAIEKLYIEELLTRKPEGDA
tara:strand:- start:193 stop:435 length:243 start_codon:yes stop_codon:yes gene_type:complete